ncbi:TIM barrel protein [Ponticoccus sp. SC2-23]|uniref:hydroxypyruvate isomerase family protein n=1 Tax=Alexandriicola marinus TaxID=2081710 RepID=UPI000FDC5F4F|nr:TIM barrel protein [Alexandriicola marinus]MBM1221698.1 TIM barrel protein [Ponticoccus sp. SC6-9]MBM1226049.1 TIM barrel protein [Ponticoccus sp. SC6-15]MBM1231346.1 TIM barrel protein [Ponticoccus sp. SC6-38]MBM1235793.1 TIM barrel protein [Ponticoccus sp. SC6-45]MBM1240369.1 TIM barrel protein [Ponticoccus sp. SC6-49]MBM1244904.1 TIM barrel protein [Ponticoccus sp. SC2-64]MBM1249267.1 TIM barrel protein [Ponticoccus sp. SC6-42]MBM1253322.1 TIM barrel protein [Ponticoccus sp. SC6-33]M
MASTGRTGPRFSANLGFLWSDLPLPDAIRAAARAGFDAVELHWPYDVPSGDVASALAETGLPCLGLNTSRGGPGDFGLAALPGREAEARDATRAALTYAADIGARHVHVMAGLTSGEKARATYLDHLNWASGAAQEAGLIILIEPINPGDAPGYFLSDPDEAARIVTEVGAPNLRIMFDCYHAQLTGGDLSRRISSLLPLIGHVQFASVPDRGPPDEGEVNYAHIFALLADLGWTIPLGAEYRPPGPTGDSLGWLRRAREAGL